MNFISIGRLPILVVLVLLLTATACGSDIVPRENNVGEPWEFEEYVFEEEPRLEAPEEVDFGLVEPGTEVAHTVTLRNTGSADLEIYGLYVTEPFGVALGGGDMPLTIAPGESFAVELTVSVLQGEGATGWLYIASNDPQLPEHQVRLTAEVLRLPEVCPIPVIEARHRLRGEARAQPDGRLDGAPLDSIELSALSSFESGGGDITAVEWAIVEQPADGAVQLTSGPSSWTNELFLELAGHYIVELHVWNDRGERSCEPARMELVALPDAALHIQLVWDTPRDLERYDDHGSDLDLHVLHPLGRWGRIPYDCYWQNPRPAWGASLDIDRGNGWGPENINLNEPEDGLSYGVGVHYFADRGLGDSFATVRIYVAGTLADEFQREPMRQGQFWHVANVNWPSGEIDAVEDVFRFNP
ncbi:hypothetical protein FRC98_19850 [Lujinxingia vulgaris]|uniref:HYDIN/VesB/CFA65-like Ig-like domain-containing protein n=1 Tax=Lujinxingia vulgaris TaxID=2600176 RepID=A0A5C6X357_9DELT|nr:hypothetical protein [Lujinxingia vulgaris]TXD33952.1 hypothetical protein FRC98_19850 [Lujinxingia vulgaris]